jgi:hypothetical protein
MSFHDYEVSKFLASGDVPFYTLIMTAMRQADSDNIELLINGWPEVWKELGARYHAPGGVLPDDPLFRCPRCGKISGNPDDKANGYCGNCHDFTGALNGEK